MAFLHPRQLSLAQFAALLKDTLPMRWFGDDEIQVIEAELPKGCVPYLQTGAVRRVTTRDPSLLLALDDFGLKTKRTRIVMSGGSNVQLVELALTDEPTENLLMEFAYNPSVDEGRAVLDLSDGTRCEVAYRLTEVTK